MELEAETPQRAFAQIINGCSLKGVLQLLTWTMMGMMCKL